MSHFYSTLKGNKGGATRCGSKSSGLVANAFGWDLGGRVQMRHDPDRNIDIVELYYTRNNNSTSKLVASFTVIDGELKCIQSNYPELLI